MLDLLPCRWRESTPEAIRCTSPLVLTQNGTVSESTCRGCALCDKVPTNGEVRAIPLETRCPYAGEAVRDKDGKAVTKDCPPDT